MKFTAPLPGGFATPHPFGSLSWGRVASFALAAFGRSAGPALIPVLSLLLLGSCTSPRMERNLEGRVLGQEYQLNQVYAVDSLPAEIRRVALLPAFADGNDALDRERFDALLAGELRQAGRFELRVLDRATLRDVVGRDTIPLAQPVPQDLIAYLEARNVDAVLQCAVSEYSGFRPYVVGLSARLFALGDGTVLWKVDELFRSTEKRTIVSARKYALENNSKRFPNRDSYAALRGPMLFSEFVLHTVVSTLPAPTTR